MVVHIINMGETKHVYKILVQNHEGKKPFWRPRQMWEENIEVYKQGGAYGLDSYDSE
jgi:hypothetical protein